MSMHFETAHGVRVVRRVMAGEGMVTPVRPLLIDGKQAEPGRERFASDHELVRLRPELFRPCDSRDRRTHEDHRDMLVRAQRSLERELGSDRTFGLGGGRKGSRPSWAL
jgi:hypothetical protein